MFFLSHALKWALRWISRAVVTIVFTFCWRFCKGDKLQRDILQPLDVFQSRYLLTLERYSDSNSSVFCLARFKAWFRVRFRDWGDWSFSVQLVRWSLGRSGLKNDLKKRNFFECKSSTLVVVPAYYGANLLRPLNLKLSRAKINSEIIHKLMLLGRWMGKVSAHLS